MELTVPRRPRLRSLAPREHGAYGQLAAPMVVALGGGAPGPSALLLSGSAWAFFLAHEPVLVLLGRRGEHARTEHGGRAAGRLLLLGLAGVALGALGLLLAAPAVRVAALAVAPLGIAFAAVVAAGAERSASGEVLAAATLAGVSVPVALASGIDDGSALGAWLVWVLGFVAVTVPVRSIGAQRRAHASASRRLLPVAGVLALAVALRGTVFGWLEVVALAPLMVSGAFLAIARPEPRRLRQIGWSIVSSMLCTSAVLLLAARRNT